MATTDLVTLDLVHAGFRHGSTRAFGCGGAHLVIGDLVSCVPVPVPDLRVPVPVSSVSSVSSGATPAAGGPEPHPARDYQVEMSAGGYLTVLDTVLTTWTEDRSPTLPLVDSDGYPGGDDPAPAHRGPDIDDGLPGPRTCPWCSAVRGGRVPRLRAAHRAAADELRATDDELRAARRRSALRPLPSWPGA